MLFFQLFFFFFYFFTHQPKHELVYDPSFPFLIIILFIFSCFINKINIVTFNKSFIKLLKKKKKKKKKKKN